MNENEYNHSLPSKEKLEKLLKTAPNPDVRQQMVDDALKGSPIKSAYIKATQPSDAEGQALLALSYAEARINAQLTTIIKADAAVNGDWDRKAAGFTLMNLWKEEMARASKNELHFILSVVLTRIGMEWLEQVDTTPI